MDQPILLARRGALAEIILNRPRVHNAFDDTLIVALHAAIVDLAGDDSVRALVLTGAGKSFSAGADLHWMRGMGSASEAENLADSLRLAALMRALNFFPKPTIAHVNGAAYGGGVGLIAACDIAIGVEDAKFSLSEVKLGLVPAVISPYVIAAIGARHARRLFISGEVFNAAQAARIGLLHEVVPASDLVASVERTTHFLAKGGPLAQCEAKRLAQRMAGVTPESAEVIDAQNAELIARLRVSAEGRQGLNAFLEKRAPNWATQNEFDNAPTRES
ncbi:MAG: enoyl-CoA hydratase-related protein [Rhodanobacteraceae bacterium]|nr:enoyl-CoA hydratase-related protein [Pseudomonadota bacterium]